MSPIHFDKSQYPLYDFWVVLFFDRSLDQDIYEQRNEFIKLCEKYNFQAKNHIRENDFDQIIPKRDTKFFSSFFLLRENNVFYYITSYFLNLKVYL